MKSLVVSFAIAVLVVGAIGGYIAPQAPIISETVQLTKPLASLVPLLALLAVVSFLVAHVFKMASDLWRTFALATVLPLVLFTFGNGYVLATLSIVLRNLTQLMPLSLRAGKFDTLLSLGFLCVGNGVLTMLLCKLFFAQRHSLAEQIQSAPERSDLS